MLQPSQKQIERKKSETEGSIYEFIQLLNTEYIFVRRRIKQWKSF